MTAPAAAPDVFEPDRDDEAGPAFEVHLSNFEGPFDLLLSLIAKHKLDVTEVALSKVTDEFIAYISAGTRSGDADGWDLDETSEFLVVASTLLDLKAARLLPRGEVEDEDDLALLEARDLLFARLLQYKAFKEIAGELSVRMADESLRHPRAVGLEERFAGLLPEVVVGLGPEELARLAAKALTPKPAPTVATGHLHQPRVSVRDEAVVVVDRLRRSGVLTFRTLAADCPSTLHVVARFLSLLELYRERSVSFEQVSALGELTVRWTGDDDDDGSVQIGAEFDEHEIAADGSERASG
ncbi:condensin subunit ScpA [Haloactinopolyspora alba]|uniref:Segregation and condensation protein A n=1 Tax=Haloactinopolyspora alba TaxID=648780 RepID=A0A2P8E257_9ACTN|nr:segregation/condensation protein A [Haloactinopolyspora alba]PSL03543.1 condensin subunit ScpA [Haloactinopolyspora alba]